MLPFVENLMGLNTMTDQVIAMDMLISAKSGMKMCAVAVTESATPEVRAAFQKQLYEAIDTHEKLTDYMMRKGYYHPYNVQEQIRLDQTNAQTALSLP
ncbi:spore coat protein [Cohnella candidum]|uniref:Spore coat protein n=1 Tax=Cohnella candidum TaxID=2674991 RepID=A0A3G3JVH5_9BACL|nr:spore coat protein [Cohnella candidum]AYQ72248.1 spore coat protein [Cohnella candidum]